MFVGRLATVGVVIAGMAWIPFLESVGKGQLYTYLQTVQSMLAPAIAAVFMLGIFSRGVSPISGLVGLVLGFALGFGRLILQANHDFAHVNYSPLLQALVDINFLYFSFGVFVFTCIVIFLVSMVTPKASVEKLAGLTYGSITAEQKAEEKGSYGFWEVFHTVVILGILVAIYVYFW